MLYSLTACTRELLQLRQPGFPELQAACAWASAACSKTPAKAPQPEADQSAEKDGVSSEANGRD